VIVLDASALLANVLREPGADRVAPELSTALIGAANVTEVLTRVLREGGDSDAVVADMDALGLSIVPVSREHAIIAAELYPLTMSAGLSLGDRLCLALAIERNVPVMTAERAWFGLPHGANVILIR
jgi:PIN domain nuclease of toxin-antitoxin system